MNLDDLKKEYIGKHFVIPPQKYIPFLPITDLKSIDQYVKSSRERWGLILDLDILQGKNSISSISFYFIKILYEEKYNNLTIKDSIFVQYKDFLNEIIFGDTREEAFNSYRLKCEVNDE